MQELKEFIKSSITGIKDHKQEVGVSERVTKLLKQLEKLHSKLILDDSARKLEKLPIEFIEWYSGMDKLKIEKAFERWQKERTIVG